MVVIVVTKGTGELGKGEYEGRRKKGGKGFHGSNTVNVMEKT